MPTPSSITAAPASPTSSVKRPALSMTALFIISMVCSLPAVIVFACWLADLLPSPTWWFAITIPLFVIGQALKYWWEWRFAGDTPTQVPPRA